MITRRRKWLIAAAGVLLAGAALWWAIRDAGKDAVKLIFLGYTNSPVTADSPFKVPTRALIMVTNTGNVTVRLGPVDGTKLRDAVERSGISAHLRSMGTNLSFIEELKTGDTVFYEWDMQTLTNEMYTQFVYVKQNSMNRLRWRMLTNSSPRISSWAAKVLGFPRRESVRLDSITNLPPAVAGAAPASGAR